ncbi:hypothetical protein FOE78_10265 [Microlunatus elymi]|uniref:Lysylphosphatidylglycerol synthase TM region n=1 Tax=Microlunatus elymi TaxID=2596828 RepID=A0A516PZ19_9ACTN|nr:lysylphosphatidylglycerol synthase domain-containing protein [Microlunatus elymi]QDP96231.1 hypothetical protein FOE78_10265 [Microlunatus elymi]
MPKRRTRPRRRWIWRLLLVALAVVVAIVIIDRVGAVDWSSVRDALSHLLWWQPLVLLVVVAGRQVLNAIPLHFYIEGVSIRRATQNDLGAILMSTVAPAPANYALRVAMFTSWGVAAARGLAGSTMNTLTLMIARFSVPLVGFVLLAVVGGDLSYRWIDLLSLLVAAAIVAAMSLVLHSDALARGVGSRAGRIAARFRRSVDPDAWAQSCVDFRSRISERFRYGFPRSLAGIVAMLAVDLSLLVLCLRFVGVSTSEAGIADIAIAYLFAFPLTILPFSGIGIVDSIIIAALVQSGGPAVEAPAFAGLVVWRVFTLGVPMLAGLAAIGLWRRTAGKGVQPT